MCVIFLSFLVHFVTNIPDDHMITIWTMLRTVPYVGTVGNTVRANFFKLLAIPPSSRSDKLKNEGMCRYCLVGVDCRRFRAGPRGGLDGVRRRGHFLDRC